MVGPSNGRDPEDQFLKRLGGCEALIFSIIVARVGASRPEEIDDLMQEVRLRVWRHAAEFLAFDDEHARRWLCRIAFNCCRDHHRRRRRTKALSLDAPTGTSDPCADSSLEPGLVALEHETADRIHIALPLLKWKWRLALVLHYYWDWSHEQIGELFNAPPTTINNWLARARKFLRNHLRMES